MELGSAIPMSRDGFGGLSISVERPFAGVVAVNVSGELDMSNRDDLRDALESARADASEKLVIDLRGLSFMDSSGLRLLLDTWNESTVSDRAMQIIVPKEGLVRRVLEISGCDVILPVVDQPDGL
jgi:anti-anti-sigma factor